MAEAGVQRRLAAILAADVVGYSRLMGADEAGTRARFNSLMDQVVRPAIDRHRGRLVKTMGDGLLAEFASVVDAVQCAADVQQGTVADNQGEAGDQRPRLRVGIHLGDVIVEGDDIHGDGVNIASRLEGLAEPGGICVSDMVRSGVRGKLPLDFDDLGEQSLKNIAEPMRIWSMRARSADAVRAGASVLTERPSIAVLPFANLSGDPEQEYFADGMAEEIITALSRFRWFYVTARNSSFSYKGRNVDVRTVGRELGVRYVLEGSVRKGANRLRITAQLIETGTGNHLWAERYDGALEDVFDLQDKIAEGVTAAIEPSVRRAEIERARRKRPESLDAYDYYLRALPHVWAMIPSEVALGLQQLGAALAIDPSYAAAHGLAAICHEVLYTSGALDPADKEAAIRHARAAIALATDDAMALSIAGFALAILERDYDAALGAIDRGLALTPNSAAVLARSALVNAYCGRYERAVDHAQRSIQFSPLDPMRYAPEMALVYANYHTGHYAEALAAAQRAIQHNPRFGPGYAMLVACRMRLGEPQAAGEAVRRLRETDPGFRVAHFRHALVGSPAQVDALAATLHKAGLPE